jgi:hypothetical protein
MQSIPEPPFGRRALLLGAAGLAGAVVLAACGSSSSGAKGGSATTDIALSPVDGTDVLRPIFDAQNGYVVTGAPQRMAIGMAGADGATTLDIPATLTFQLALDGTPYGTSITVAGHKDGVPIGYFPLRTTFDKPGNYQATATVAGKASSVPFVVADGKTSTLLAPGSKLKAVDTPTNDDHRGVEPICTRPAGTCPFHTMTVTQALATGKPTAVLVSTPEFCQIGVCGPVLDLLIEAAGRYPGVQIIHAEVYANAAALKDASQAALAPIVDAYGLTYEPALFVARGDGTVVDRLDNVFDRVELNEALTKVA